MKTTIILLAAAFTGALVAHFALKLPLGLTLLLFFVGWPLVGTLITIDDDLPGGWSNPDGTVRPPWRAAPFWGQVAGGVALSAAGFAIDVGWRSSESVPCWLVSVAMAFLAAALFTRRRWR